MSEDRRGLTLSCRNRFCPFAQRPVDTLIIALYLWMSLFSTIERIETNMLLIILHLPVTHFLMLALCSLDQP